MIRGSIRWLPAAALFALMPKCLVCLAAYAGVGAALGVKLGGSEICGASAGWLGGAMIGSISAVGGVLGAVMFRRLTTQRARTRPADRP